MVLPASRVHMAMNLPICASSWSAACSRIAAREAAGVASQPGCAATALASARCTVASSAGIQLPTSTRRSAGLVTLIASPDGLAPGTSGLAVQLAGVAATCSASLCSCSSWLRLMPMELLLLTPWLRYRSTGSGIWGWGMDW